MRHVGLLAAFVLFFGGALSGQVSPDQAFSEGRYEEAIRAFTDALSRPDANKVSIYNMLGLANHMLGQFKEAESSFKSGLRLNENAAQLENNLGALFFSQRKFRDAENHFRRALSAQPEGSIPRHNLRAARYARENGRKAQAAANVIAEKNKLLIDRGPSEDGVLQVTLLIPEADRQASLLAERRGDSFLARKLFDDAIIEYQKAIRIDSYNPSTLNRLGIAYHQSQKLNEAERQYRQVLRINPYYIEALNNLGSIEYVRKRYSRALDRYEEALKIRPQSPTILQNVGACYFAMERFEDGIRVYRQALAIDPKVFESQSNFGTLIQTPHRNEPLMNYSMAKVFAETGDKDRAISYLYRAVEEGFKDLEMLKAEKAFAIFVDDERFVRLVASITPVR